MAYKNYDDQRAAWRDHYNRNKQRYIDKAKSKRQDIRDFLNEIKESSPCVGCGNFFPARVMDFHHRNPEDKEFTIGHSKTRSFSRKRIEKELEKCDVICANCHRLLET